MAFGWVNDQWLAFQDGTLQAVEIRDGVPQSPVQVHDQGVFSQWSATADSLAVTGTCGGSTGLCVIPFTETGPSAAQLIQSGTFAIPTWSPSGQHITFSDTASLYLVGRDGAALVPMYAPGLPMQMALFESLGGRDAVFYVMPLLAGVAVWATYALGTCAGGRRVGVVAAVLLAASPTVLFQVTHAPMSDLPAAAWWTVALAAS
jgi:hypothetical protein